jgi:exodeoxyribonuclease VII small subunit
MSVEYIEEFSNSSTQSYNLHMATKKSSTSLADKPLPTTYEAAMAELEGIVTAMDEGRLSLEDTLASYQRGAALLKFCRDKLAVVEQQVKILEDGELKLFLQGQ